mmetsp:Transcript_17983/g.44413  ORF Transcript_17983/g.44413 Transcript_17983/m.44413 type:complete len:225 (-) Transcript_17983:801-1475(-)
MHSVTGFVPQVKVEHVGCGDFIISTIPVLFSDKFNQLLVDTISVWKPKGTSGRQFVEEHKLLLGHDASVITFLGLFHILLPNLQLLLIGERNTVDSLQRIIVGIAQPVSSRDLSGSKGLDLSSVGNVRTTAQIDQVSASVNGGTASIGNLGGQNLHLEWVVSKELQSLILGNDHTLEFLLLFGNLTNFLFNSLVIIFTKIILAHVGIVKETISQRRSNSELVTK